MYNPAEGSEGGKVTVGDVGGVTIPSGTGDHQQNHPDSTDEFIEINAFTIDYYAPSTSDDDPYRHLKPGNYYLESNFKMDKSLAVQGSTVFCLNGSNLGADNDQWIYEMGHVFWAPNPDTLTVLDCQRNLNIVWLQGGQVYLKCLKKGEVLYLGAEPDPDSITIKMNDPDDEGHIQVDPVNKTISLSDGATITRKQDGNVVQTITKKDGVLEMTTEDGKTVTITPPDGQDVKLKLPENGDSGIVMEAPKDSTVQVGEDMEITLVETGEVEADGTVSCPEGSTVKTGDKEMKIDQIGGGAPSVPVRPDGTTRLPAGSKVTFSNPGEDAASMEIECKDEGELGFTEKVITPPKGSEITTQKKDSVTIVIALPWPEDGSDPPDPLKIEYTNNGLLLPPGTKVTVGNDEPMEVTGDKPVLDPETGKLGKKPTEDPDTPSGPVNPNEPVGEREELEPGVPVSTDDGTKIELKDDGSITITPPPGGTKPSVTITPQSPADPADTPQPPFTDETGKVFIDGPFKVETEDGPDIIADKGGSVDPDGNVTGETVTVEQKEPDGTTKNETTYTAPEGDAVKAGPDGEVKVPAGSEIKQDDVTVKIDKVPDQTKPVTVKPDNGIELQGGSEVTITPENPQQPGQKYTVTVPAQGGEVKLNPDQTVTLPPNAKVVDQNGKEIIISSGGGTINLATGEITSRGQSGGSGSGGSGGSGSSGSSDSSDSSGSPGRPASYIIAASASVGGRIYPDNQVAVAHGADKTFTIKPGEGYEISDVLVDGKSVGPVTSYTFRNVRSAHTIQALFVAEGMSGHSQPENCPKDETCPIWPYTDSVPTAWYHDGVHYCIENHLMNGTTPELWAPDIPLTRGMIAQVLYNRAGRPAVSGGGSFYDVGDQEWCWPAITWGAHNNVLRGYSDGSYRPQDPITREQLAVILWRYAGQPQTDSQLNFSDAAAVSDYARQALLWACQHGVVRGYSDGTFRPQDYVTRAESAQMIMRYFNL